MCECIWTAALAVRLGSQQVESGKAFENFKSCTFSHTREQRACLLYSLLHPFSNNSIKLRMNLKERICALFRYGSVRVVMNLRSIKLQSKYDCKSRKLVKVRLRRAHRSLSKNSNQTLISVSRLFELFNDSHTGVTVDVFFDDQKLPSKTIITPISKRTFANFFNAPISPDLLDIHYDTIAWVDAALQMMGNRVKLIKVA